MQNKFSPSFTIPLAPLERSFYLNDVVEVAQALIGKILSFQNRSFIITETEAYRGSDDPAAHSFKGKTPRTEVMFGLGGFTYVYFIYGMYHCLNIVTGPIDDASAVLLRGMVSCDDLTQSWNGPGKICRDLGINKSHNNIDLVTSSIFNLHDAQLKLAYKSLPRVGISKGQERLWRFVAENHKLDVYSDLIYDIGI